MPNKRDPERPQAPIAAARIAILMCTKDGAAYLAEQLKSIAEQTHANWSLVVSDDGSTDSTRDIVKRFAGHCTQTRQHGDNLIGSNSGWRARLIRARMILKGRFSDWNDKNIAALERVPASLIRPESRMTLQLFVKARTASLFKRLYYLWRSGVYRQTALGNIGLVFATALKRI